VAIFVGEERTRVLRSRYRLADGLLEITGAVGQLDDIVVRRVRLEAGDRDVPGRSITARGHAGGGRIEEQPRSGEHDAIARGFIRRPADG